MLVRPRNLLRLFPASWFAVRLTGFRVSRPQRPSRDSAVRVSCGDCFALSVPLGSAARCRRNHVFICQLSCAPSAIRPVWALPHQVARLSPWGLPSLPRVTTFNCKRIIDHNFQNCNKKIALLNNYFSRPIPKLHKSCIFNDLTKTQRALKIDSGASKIDGFRGNAREKRRHGARFYALVVHRSIDALGSITNISV